MIYFKKVDANFKKKELMLNILLDSISGLIIRITWKSAVIIIIVRITWKSVVITCNTLTTAS